MRAKNRHLIIAAVCFGFTVVLFFGMRIAVINFIEFPIGLFGLAMVASLITGIVFCIKALKRERSPRTYAVAAVGVLILTGLIFLFARPDRFNKEAWNATERSHLFYRASIVGDLMKNHLRGGMTHGEVLELLGDSLGMWHFRYVDIQGDSKRKMIYRDYGTLPPDEDFCMAYDIPSFRGEEIHPPTSKVLIIEFTEGRTVDDFYLQEWQLIDQILKFEIDKSVVLPSHGGRGRNNADTRTAVGTAAAVDALLANKLYNMAIDCNLQYRNEQALALYDSALMILPREPEFLTNRGYTKYELQDTLGAMADYGKALDIDSLSSTALANIAVVFFDVEQYAMALSYYLRSVEIADSEAEHFNLGVCRYNVGDYRGALDDFTTYSKGKHQHNALFALYLMGNCCEFLGDMEEGRHCWELVDKAGGPGKKAELDDLHIGISGSFNDYKN